MSVPSPTLSVVVTGGASGIGLALSKYFASQGHKVAMLDIDAANGPGIAAAVASEHPSANIIFKNCDVSSWDDQAATFKAVFDQFGCINIVMANAGISEGGTSSLFSQPRENGEPSKPGTKTLDVNLTGTIYSVHLAAHYIRKSKSPGSIVCTSSNAGIYPFPAAPLYATSKAGVIGLVRSMARPLAKDEIQINALAPAILETNLAPSKELFEKMTMTPMATLIQGVQQLLDDRTVSGEVAEIHGDKVTIRKHHEYVDKESRKNLQVFEDLGYA